MTELNLLEEDKKNKQNKQKSWANKFLSFALSRILIFQLTDVTVGMVFLKGDFHP